MVLADVARVESLRSESGERANEHYPPDRAELSDGYPLARAAANGNRVLVELLLAHGADVDARFHR